MTGTYLSFPLQEKALVELALMVILLMCLDHGKLFAVVTPGYLALLLCSITESQINILVVFYR